MTACVRNQRYVAAFKDKLTFYRRRKINYNLLIKTICENLDRVGGRLDSVELKTVKGTDRWDVGGQWVCR